MKWTDMGFLFGKLSGLWAKCEQLSVIISLISHIISHICSSTCLFYFLLELSCIFRSDATLNKPRLYLRLWLRWVGFYDENLMNIWKNASHWFFILREALIVCLYMYACRERRKRERQWRVRWASKGSKWSTRYVMYVMVGSLFPFFPSFYWIIYYSPYQFVYLDVYCAM